MYCSNCGYKLKDTSKYCEKCGTPINQHTEKEVKVIDENKVIKRDSFKLWKKKNFGFYESGTLTLYKNRCVWEGSSSFVIKLDDIVNVSISDGFGVGLLSIYDDDRLPYKFQMTNKSTSAIALFLDLGLAAMSDKKISDIEVWRQLIDKFRLDL